MSNLTVSIAMTTYNGERYLHQQLKSLIDQDLTPADIQIGDDGSTDGTVALIESFSKTSPVPINLVLNEKRLGWKENFIAVSSRCNGDVVAFCDQDDYWRRDKLSRIAPHFTDSDTKMVFHQARTIDQFDQPLGHLYPDSMFRQHYYPHMRIDTWTPILGFTMVFRSALNTYANLWPISTDKLDAGSPAPHDQWIQFLAGALGGVAYIREPLADYRIHQTNNVGHSSRRWDFKTVKAAINESHDKVAHRVATTKNRLHLLDKLLDFPEGNHLAVLKAREDYADSLTLHEQRLSLYESSPQVRRLLLLLRLLMKRQYTSTTIPTAREEILRDAVSAFVM